MKTFLFSLLTATATAQHLMGEWCDECTTIVNAFDSMDAQSIADQLCPLIEENTICEELAPYVIGWVQEHCTADLICSALCDDDYYINEIQDPEPTEDPPMDLHETRDLGHHPFDIPRPEEPPIGLNLNTTASVLL